MRDQRKAPAWSAGAYRMSEFSDRFSDRIEQSLSDDAEQLSESVKDPERNGENFWN